jgi:hypothetical protein
MTKETIKIGENPYSSYSSMLTGEVGRACFDRWKWSGPSADSKQVMESVCSASSGKWVYNHRVERIDNPSESKVEDWLSIIII